MAECKKCIHSCVCKTAEACDGYVSGCEHFKEERNGVWLVDDYDSGDPGYYAAFIEVHCSECGYDLGAESGQYGWSYGDPFPMPYCPNCGADMRGE